MKNKTNYVYLVYCNPNEPIVYAIYQNKKSALKYANQLIKWREESTIARNGEFGFYHKFLCDDSRKESDYDKIDKTIFSASLKIKCNSLYNEDGCIIKVVRRPLLY